MIMKILGQILCFSVLILTFSCDSDSSFDNDNPDAKISGEWKVKSVESESYESTMTSPNGDKNTSQGSFIGVEIDMDLSFNTDNSFSTQGDYVQILSIENNQSEPIMVESRYNDFAGGGTWKVDGDILKIKNEQDASFQDARLTTFTDTEVAFEYAYTRTIVEGTITRLINIEVSYVLEKK